MIQFRRDCRLFKSDRPCLPHKTSGYLCESCPEYDPVDQNILILKFDAIGDVLRTTSILPGIKAAHPRSRVVWYTRERCGDLFLGNKNVDSLLFLEDPASFPRLMAQRFDVIFSLDPSEMSASIAAVVPAAEVRGFTVDGLGRSVPANSSAETWYEMGLNDRLKKENKRTFFDHLYALAGLTRPRDFRPQLTLSDVEKNESARWANELGIADGRPVIGFNPGAGGRWRYKRWNTDYFSALIDQTIERGLGHVVLLGGGDDREIVQAVIAGCRHRERIVHSGAHGLRRYILHAAHCDIVVCGDTLTLHIATALHKKVVALFGPTSATEIDLFGRGEKLSSDLPCLVCFLSDCDVRPTCMDSLPVNAVFAALQRVLNQECRE